MEIRTARVEDAPTIARFQERLAEETEDFRLDPAVVAKGVQAVFDDPSKGAYWVAVDGGEVIASLLTLPEWSDWRNGTVLWIHSVYVLPDHRRRSVFRTLYQGLRERVESSPDLRGLRLFVDKRNTRAKATYESLGMTAEHYELYEWMSDGL